MNLLTAIIHDPSDSTFQWNTNQQAYVQSHVNSDTTVSYFYVQWNSEGFDAGEVIILSHEYLRHLISVVARSDVKYTANYL